MGDRSASRGQDVQLEALLQGIRDLVSDRMPSDRPSLPANIEGEIMSHAAYAEALVRARSSIGRFLDARLFADPAYDMLLSLFVANERGREVAVTDCAFLANVALTTGLRWLELLVSGGLVERYADDDDRRRTWVRLTPTARQSIAAYVEATYPGLPLR